MTISYRAKVFIVRLAKMFPFLLCAVILVSFLDCGRALITEDYVCYDGDAILNTKLCWFIGDYFVYGVLTTALAFVLSYAMETCIYNKLCVYYSALNIAQKQMFSFEMDSFVIGVIITLNIIISSFLVYKGVALYVKNRNL